MTESKKIDETVTKTERHELRGDAVDANAGGDNKGGDGTGNDAPSPAPEEQKPDSKPENSGE